MFGKRVVHSNVLMCLNKSAGKILVTHKKRKKEEKENFIPACMELNFSFIPLVVFGVWAQEEGA